MIINTIRGQLYSLFLIFTLFIVISLIASLIVVYDHFADENYINLINEQFFLVQQITESAVSERVDPSTIENVNKFELGNQILKEGGIYITEEGNEYYVAPLRGETEILNSLSQNWQTYRQDLDQILNHPAGDMNHEIMENALLADSLVLSKNIEAIASRIEAQSNVKHIWLIYLQVLFLVLVIPLTIWGFNLIRRRIVNPLSELSTAARRIRDGQLHEPVKAHNNDEIGQLARSFDDMRTEIINYQGQLEQRIAERTHELEVAFELSQEIVSQLDLANLLQSAIAKMQSIMRVKSVSLCLLTQDRKNIEMVANSNGIPADIHLIQSLELDLPMQVASNGNLATSQVTEMACSFFRSNPKDICLAVPLQAADQVLGAMCVIRDQNTPYEDTDKRAMNLLANSVAIAISNYQLNEEIRKQTEQSAIYDERERLASELHDNLAQRLSILTLQTETLADLVETHQDIAVLNQIHEIQENVKLSLEEARLMIRGDAIPSQINAPDVIHELIRFTDELQNKSRISVEINGDETSLYELSSIAQNQAIMIIREALTNILKHSKARKTIIHMGQDKNNVLISVTDDGIGFEVDKVDSKNHFGLGIMRTRAERSGGILKLESKIGYGTTLTVSFPRAKGQM